MTVRLGGVPKITFIHTNNQKYNWGEKCQKKGTEPIWYNYCPINLLLYLHKLYIWIIIIHRLKKKLEAPQSIERLKSCSNMNQLLIFNVCRQCDTLSAQTFPLLLHNFLNKMNWNKKDVYFSWRSSTNVIYATKDELAKKNSKTIIKKINTSNLQKNWNQDLLSLHWLVMLDRRSCLKFMASNSIECVSGYFCQAS